MPTTEWYLKPYNSQDRYIRVQIDPARISGSRGTFGPTLLLPYTVPEGAHARSAGAALLSLEGWISWSGEAPYLGKLRIPSQTHQEGQPQLEVPLTDHQIEAIEQKRNGGNVLLTISLAGVAVFPPAQTGQPTYQPGSPLVLHPVPISNTSSEQTGIEREQWLRMLQQLGAGARRLVELPEPLLPHNDQRWRECLRLLDNATQSYRRGEYEPALVACRQIVEGIPHVLCDAWGLPKPQNGQPSFEKWLKAIEGRLTGAWPQDTLTPGMLYTLLSGAWKWLAPAPHYGTGLPLREEVAFALGLCTDVLHFAGQVLQAHPHPIVAAP